MPVSGNKTPAAIGMPKLLYMNAPNKFCLMFLMLALAKAKVSASTDKRPVSKVKSALSMATSVPSPMAIPTLALIKAGASLIPSPTMATISPLSLSSIILACFCSGKTPAMTSSMPTSSATACTVSCLSPLSNITRLPARLSAAMASLASGFTGSLMAITPTRRPSLATYTGVLPSWAKTSTSSCRASTPDMPSMTIKLILPMASSTPETIPTMPFP